MKAAFLTSSLIAPKGKASPASPATAPTKLLGDQSARMNGVSRVYQRVKEYSDPHHYDEHADDNHEYQKEDVLSNGSDNPFSANKGAGPADKQDAASANRRQPEQGDDTVEDIDILELKDAGSSTEFESVIETHSPARDAKAGRDSLPQTRKGPYAVPDSPSRALSRPTRAEDIPEEKVEEIADEVSKLKKDKLGRIRISVRMAPKDHLQLKLIAAHTQMSAQAIFETALEEYVANHGTELLPETCSCILDKSTL